jgi:REP element-mobilizing transposase RayT
MCERAPDRRIPLKRDARERVCMGKLIGTSSRNEFEYHNEKHRFEHWYVDNQGYFITARCRDRFPAFASEQAKTTFWEKLEQYAREFGFVLWIVTIMDNHFHLLGYLKRGVDLKTMMQRLHGSVAKLVNDMLPERRAEFWRDSKGREYFDGCIRNALQGRRTFRYIERQALRHGVRCEQRIYRHTRKYIEMERAIQRAEEINAFLPGVPYKRYGE